MRTHGYHGQSLRNGRNLTPAVIFFVDIDRFGH